VEAGFAKLGGVEQESIPAAMETPLNMKGKPQKTAPYREGKAARKLLRFL